MIDLISSIQHGIKVIFRYKMTDSKGNVLFNNLNGKSVSYVHGTGEISTDLEKNMTGLKVGESKSFAIKDEFDHSSLYTVDVIIDSLEEMPSITNTHCDTNCNCT